jgi:electron transport complex protein RnfB
MTSIITAALVIGGISVILGVAIAIAQKIFFVPLDTRVAQIYEMLPHYDCGACGTPGCQAMAGELVDGTIKIAKCRPAKPEQREAIQAKLTELGC